ncbi:MAG: molybdopterin-dependent oxidoreductase, partial [Bacteroidota bacterium]
KLKATWKVNELPTMVNENQKELLDKGMLKNLFIFGEDPIGCSMDKTSANAWLGKASFVMVQDYFMTETAKQANLILPASFPIETGGSYTNTQKVLQKFDKSIPSKLEYDNCQQLFAIMDEFGKDGMKDVVDVMMEAITLLPTNVENTKHNFVQTSEDNANRIFDYGCDALVKYFDDKFVEAFK